MKRIIWIFGILFANLTFAQNFQIGHVTVQPVDSSRNNRVITDTEIYYPANTAGNNVPVANGQFPIIVFGHGFTIRWEAYDYVWKHFVPKGYICIFPRTEGNISPNHGNFGGDLRFLSAWMKQENIRPGSMFFGKVDPVSAVMGHSMGGGSTYLAASNNSEFATVVSFAGAETNPSAKSAAKLVTCPVLNIAGEEDCVAKVNEHQIPIFDSTASTVKYYVELKGASHCNFTNGSATSCFSAEGISCFGYGPFISRQDQNDRTIRLSEPWIEFFLKGKCSEWDRFIDTLDNYFSTQKVSARTKVGTPAMPAAQTPTITQNGNTLTSSSATTYQWFSGSNPIPNANSQSFSPSGSGTYSVKITDQFGCEATSAPFVYSTTNLVSNFDSINLTLFPNPTESEITISGLENIENFQISVCDLAGKSLIQQKLTTKTIDVSALPSGLYFVKLTSENQTAVLKFSKL